MKNFCSKKHFPAVAEGACVRISLRLTLLRPKISSLTHTHVLTNTFKSSPPHSTSPKLTQTLVSLHNFGLLFLAENFKEENLAEK